MVYQECDESKTKFACAHSEFERISSRSNFVRKMAGERAAQSSSGGGISRDSGVLLASRVRRAWKFRKRGPDSRARDSNARRADGEGLVAASRRLITPCES